MIACLWSSSGAGALPPTPGNAVATRAPDSPAEAVEREVRDNVRKQAVGGHSLEQFNLPPQFVSRVADRIIRSSFEERFRIVVDDTAAAAGAAVATGAAGGGDDAAESDRARQSARVRLMITAGIVAASGIATMILLLRRRKADA